MSKLITNTIRHTGGSADNITLDNSQNVTVEAKLTVANKDDDNVNVLEVKNDNGNVSGGFTQASDGDGQIFSKKNDGTNTVLFRSDGDSYLLGGDLGIGESAPEELLHITHASAPAIQLEATAGGPYKTLVKMGGNDLKIMGSDGQIQFFQGNADGDSSSEKFRISSHGGVTFNGDTAAANCLDDYEEGTYNPTWAGITNYGSGYNDWTYTKIGRLVNILGTLRLKTTVNDGTDVSFTLPFTPAAQTNAGNTGRISVGQVMHNNVQTGSNGLCTYVYGGNAYGYFYKLVEDSSWTILEANDLSLDDTMYVNFTYIT